MFEHQKPKSSAKKILTKGPELTRLVLSTLKTISDVVGGTLGPGGQPVLIERFEQNMAPKVTKDGVTVFRSLGFLDAAQHVIMESTRDAATKTAQDAGDGTTTATVLAESIARRANEFCERHRDQRPQKVVRRLEQLFREVVEPTLRAEVIRANLEDEAGRKLLRNVAKLSANGDDALADAVMKCFDITGDAGNVTIVESSGPSGYEVEQVEGYPIPIGYEDCCAKFYSKFINNAGRQMCVMEDPVFILYHGVLNDTNTAYGILAKVGDKFQQLIEGGQSEYRHHNVVFVATGFSEHVLATFAAGWGIANAIKIFPLVVPKSPMQNFGAQFLEDLSAITGAAIFDPINKPLDMGELEDLGPGVASFEAERYRSTIIGRAAASDTEDDHRYEDALMEQIAAVEQQLKHPASEYDKILLQERLAKLTGGIAKLRVVGSSNGELREKCDRADDAVCAVRGAIKHGCLPGGGWGLLKATAELFKLYPEDLVVKEVLGPALGEPVMRLYHNCGMTDDEIARILTPINAGCSGGEKVVYDLMEDRHGDPVELGILDSAPAVIEAIRNSLSIAAQMGTVCGVVVFPRDGELERKEALDVQEWLRNANINPADERA